MIRRDPYRIVGTEVGYSGGLVVVTFDFDDGTAAQGKLPLPVARGLVEHLTAVIREAEDGGKIAPFRPHS